MKTKNKFIIACSILGTITLGGIIALIAVIAAFNTKVEGGGFKVSYTAYDLDASVYSAYYIGEDYDAQSFSTYYGQLVDPYYSSPELSFTSIGGLTFLGEDGKSETKSFEETDVTIGRKQACYLKYKIVNTSYRANCLISGVCNWGENNNNVSVYYYKYTGDAGYIWQEITVDAPSLVGGATIDMISNTDEESAYLNATTLVYKIVATVPTKDMNFDASFDFTLVVDPE